jgi:hypothetical protein
LSDFSSSVKAHGLSQTNYAKKNILTDKMNSIPMIPMGDRTSPVGIESDKGTIAFNS